MPPTCCRRRRSTAWTVPRPLGRGHHPPVCLAPPTHEAARPSRSFFTDTIFSGDIRKKVGQLEPRAHAGPLSVQMGVRAGVRAAPRRPRLLDFGVVST